MRSSTKRAKLREPFTFFIDYNLGGRKLASELRRGEVFGRSTAVLALRDPTGESDLANLLRPSLRPTDRCVSYAATIALDRVVAEPPAETP